MRTNKQSVRTDRQLCSVYKSIEIVSLFTHFDNAISDDPGKNCCLLYLTNSADTEQTPQNAASDQGLYWLLTEYYICSQI